MWCPSAPSLKCLVYKFCCLRLFVVVYKLVIVVLPLDEYDLPENLVIGRNVSLQVLLPGAVC